ncbi:hypothetical protein Taro_000380, partial [Colocasia esculenta]|nr:hypothetical protein [Colocasia esculenta]
MPLASPLLPTVVKGLRVELQNVVVPLMCKIVEEAAQRAATLERSIRTRQVGESDSGSFRLPQQSVGVSKGKAPVGPSSSSFGKWGQKLKQAFKGKGRGWGGRQQFQQGRGRPEVEESQQSTARQPIIPPGYRCYNCNQPGHLIRNCPYLREYGYGRGVQQQPQPQQSQQPQAGQGIPEVSAQGFCEVDGRRSWRQHRLTPGLEIPEVSAQGFCEVDGRRSWRQHRLTP